MTLLQLAKLYESDVETRLSVIKDEFNNVDTVYCNEKYIGDRKAEIGHWEATLKVIQQTIKEN